MLVIRYNENKTGATRWEDLVYFSPFVMFFCIAGYLQAMPFFSICTVFMDYAFLTSVILNVFCFKLKLYQLLFWNNHYNNQGRSKTELLNFSKNSGIKYPLLTLISTVFMETMALITQKTNQIFAFISF